MTDLTWLVVAWIVGAVLIAWAADRRGQSILGWFVLALVLTPVLAVVMLLVTPRKAA